MRRAPAGLALALLVVTVVAGPAATAAAEAVDGQRFSELVVRAAAGDGAALAELRQVDRVDGRPVDMATALADRPQERLGALRGQRRPAGVDADAARRSAQEILDRRAFHPPDVPRPLEGALRRIGQWLEPVGQWLAPLGRAVDAAFRWLTAEPERFVPLAVGVVLGAAVIALVVGRRRMPLGAGPGGRHLASRSEDPVQLERSADEAEGAGDLALAVRLRFRAGLVRLDGAGVLRLRPSLTTGAVTRAVPSETLVRLATDFDEIAYGGRPAAPGDVAAARTGWSRVLAEARR
ncbi:MAG TPA: DUF4129 domain-containing protein [Acidimicrobiales bacterium]|nr:DUF4129 domain-containing protein [Acidimicrobiales bacterium]